MDARKIEPHDHKRLEAAGGYLRQYSHNIIRWKDQGYISPDDCYVFMSRGALVGGVCFCDDIAGEREILDFALIDTELPYGAQTLKNTLQMAAKEGTRAIGYNLYNDTDQYAGILDLFLQSGFQVVQKKKSYTYERADPPVSIGALTFQSIAEVGETKFINTVMDVTVGTLDKLMAGDAALLGGDMAAREYVDRLKAIDFNRDWWRLGYDQNKLVGLIIPQKFDETNGGINYIGVLPQHRGRGYGAALLAEGAHILYGNGLHKIYADIDAGNYPMAIALEQVGFAFRMEESVLTYTL